MMRRGGSCLPPLPREIVCPESSGGGAAALSGSGLPNGIGYLPNLVVLAVDNCGLDGTLFLKALGRFPTSKHCTLANNPLSRRRSAHYPRRSQHRRRAWDGPFCRAC